MVTALVPFPYIIQPVANIAPFTYADGATYLTILQTMQDWLNKTLVPAMNDAYADALAQAQNGVGNAEATVAAAKLDWDTRYDALNADLSAQIALLNDGAVAALNANAGSTTGAALRTLINSSIDSKLTAQTVIGFIASTYYSKSQADALFATKTDLTNQGAAATAATDSKLAAAAAAAGEAYTRAEMVVVPDRVTGPVGQRLTLPTHVAGNVTGEAVHPSVAYRSEGWNGYPYWMAFTPYQGGDDSMEDPNVVCSRDGITWTVPAGLTNPLDDAVGSPSLYNSDTDAVFGPDNKLYVFWRTFDPNAVGREEQLYYRSSSDGVTWGPKTLVVQADQNVVRYIAPSFVYEDGGWTCWFLNMVPNPFRIMRMRSTGNTPTAWGAPTYISYSNGSQPAAYMANRTPWHPKVIKTGGRYHMLVSDYSTDDANPARDLIYLNSPDGIVWTSAIGPCIPRLQPGQHDMMYRATLIPAIRRGVYGFRVWYSAFNTGVTPNTWSIYRTFISDGPHVERGSFTDDIAGAADAATPTYKARQITFDRFFKYPPDVQVTCSTGFIGVAAHPISTTGFQFNIDNPVQSPRAGLTFTWTATEPDGPPTTGI